MHTNWTKEIVTISLIEMQLSDSKWATKKQKELCVYEVFRSLVKLTNILQAENH